MASLDTWVTCKRGGSERRIGEVEAVIRRVLVYVETQTKVPSGVGEVLRRELRYPVVGREFQTRSWSSGGSLGKRWKVRDECVKLGVVVRTVRS